jgi:uncharacterized protein (TIGR03067 family)
MAVLLVAASWSIAAPVTKTDPVKEEMKRFQGRWVPVYVETEGQPIPPEGVEDLAHLDFIIEGDRVVLKEDGQVMKGWDIHFTIDPTTAPRTIDLSVAVEGTRAETSLGIYRLEAETLKICILPPTKEPERPTEFKTKPGSKNLIWHFRRKPQ